MSLPPELTGTRRTTFALTPPVQSVHSVHIVQMTTLDKHPVHIVQMTNLDQHPVTLTQQAILPLASHTPVHTVHSVHTAYGRDSSRPVPTATSDQTALPVQSVHNVQTAQPEHPPVQSVHTAYGRDSSRPVPTATSDQTAPPVQSVHNVQTAQPCYKNRTRPPNERRACLPPLLVIGWNKISSPSAIRQKEVAAWH